MTGKLATVPQKTNIFESILLSEIPIFSSVVVCGGNTFSRDKSDLTMDQKQTKFHRVNKPKKIDFEVVFLCIINTHAVL